MLEKKLIENGLELVIGMETHVRLNTKTKLFCGCPNEENTTPNENICPICTGQMGVLPSVNKQAVYLAIRFGKAVKSSFENKTICWDRKHYEYPDNPKNIQITQYTRPIIPDGKVTCFREDGSVFTINLEQVHLEEDAAKLIHETKQSLVDFNKAGVPLIEIVTTPCIRAIKDAAIYAQYVHRIVQNLGISNANLEKGEFKSDVSVSLRKKGTQDLNPRTEIKNLNSFKFMMQALEEEVEKQFNYFVENGDFRPEQTTVLWDETLKQTQTMRKKEYEADYRFITEPDLPFVDISKAVQNTSVADEKLPFAVEKKLIDGGVLPKDAKFFTSDPLRSETFSKINDALQAPAFVAKTLTNNLKPEDYARIENIKAVIEIFKAVQLQKITVVVASNAIKKILENPKFDYKAFFKEHSIDKEKINATIEKIISENTQISEEIKSGNTGKAGVLVGKVMAVLGKGVSGNQVRQKILSTLLGSPSKENTAPKTTQQKKQSQTPQEKEQIQKTPVIVKDSYRTHLIKNLTENDMGSVMELSGWVTSVRDHGDLVFIDLREADGGVLQVRLSRECFPDLQLLIKIKPETIISVKGILILRDVDDVNPSIKTGKWELQTEKLAVLNLSKTLPFEIKRATKTNEQTRFQYKFLDHRNAEVRRAIVNRHKVIKLIRDLLDKEHFLEIETPILTAGTDEGAREFIVPSRKVAGSFYTLPQAPQQFKQMLMVGGFDRYFQIAKCFRDEDSRGDRQPEFTQLDLEMSYASMQEIIALNTDIFIKIVKEIYGKKWILKPFQKITYKEAMEKYGCDRPDMRFGLEMQDITDIVKETEFQVFRKPIDEGGIVKCIKVNKTEQGGKRLSKGQIENLTDIAIENGLGGLAYIIVNENELQSPIIKFLGENIAQKIIDVTDAKIGDIVLFSAADDGTANKALDAVRQALGALLNLINPKELCPVWVVDFPMFEKNDEGRWTFTHNPFSMPAIKDLQKHLDGKEIDSIHRTTI